MFNDTNAADYDTANPKYFGQPLAVATGNPSDEALRDAAFERLPDFCLVEILPDEDELALALLVLGPEAIP